jgi:hypothetical protein
MEAKALSKQQLGLDCLEELIRQRTRLAYELVRASKSERCTTQYLEKERRMNAYTVGIGQLRRRREEGAKGPVTLPTQAEPPLPFSHRE